MITFVLGSDKVFSFGVKTRFTVEKNVELAELPSLGKEFSVSFGLFINKMPTVPYAQVIHLTTGANNDEMGSTIPGLWVTPAKRVMVMSGISGVKNVYKEFPVEENKWVNMLITQKIVEGKVINKDFEFKIIKNVAVHV